MKQLFILTTLLLSYSSMSQNRIVDSLKSSLLNCQVDSQKLDLYNKLSYYSISSDYVLAKNYADSAMALATLLNDKLQLFQAHNNKATLFFKQGELDSAQAAYNTIRDLYDNFNQANPNAVEATYHQGMGAVYYYKSNFDSSLFHFNQSIKINNQLNRYHDVSRTQSNIGAILYSQNKYDQALSYFQQAESTIQNKTNDSLALVTVLNNIGLIFNDLNDFDKAKHYFDEGLILARKIKSTTDEEMLLLNLGDAYVSVDSLDKALNYYLSSLAIKKANHIPHGINLVRIGTIHQLKKNYQLAEKYLNNALTQLKKYENNLPLIDALNTLADVYIATDRLALAQSCLVEVKQLLLYIEHDDYLLEVYKKLMNLGFQMRQIDTAAIYSQHYAELYDSISNKNIQEKVYELETKYELKEKQNEISLLEQKQLVSHKQQQLLVLTILLILLSSIGLFFYFRFKNANLKNNIRIKDLQSAQKNKELQHSSLLLSKRNADLSMFLEHLKTLKADLTIQSVSKLEKEIKTIIKVENDWQEYLNTFNALNPQFYQNLKEKGIELTKSEKRLSAFISQEFTIKEIANIINISPRSVETSRTRLRKKLQLEKGDNLKSYLRSML